MNQKNLKTKTTNPIFEILNAIQNKNYSWTDLDDNLKLNYNQFMINRFICSYLYLLPVAEQLSTQKLSNEAHYNILLEYVKHTKHYFKYDYFKKQKNIDKTLSLAIMKQYNVGPTDANNYNLLLSEEQKSFIINKWSDFLAMSPDT